MRTRLMAAAAIGTAALAAIAGCGSSGSSSTGSSNGKVTLTFFGADYGTGPSNSTTKYWDAVAAAFHQAHPSITVNVQTVNWNDFPTKSATLIQNKQYPDIMEGNPAPPYAQSGLIYPVSDVLSSDVVSNLIPKFLKDGQYQGTNYGIPFTTSTRAMYYNKKIFAAAGISAPPKTWAELQSDAAKIKAKGSIGYGMPLGSEEAQAELLLWFLGNGGGYLSPQGKYDIDSPQNIATLSFMKQLAASGDTQPNPGGTDRKTVWSEFAQGKIGMVLGSPAVIPIIQQAGVLQSSDYATADVPGKAGPLSDTLGVHDDIVAFKAGGASHQAAIKQFLDFVYQDKWQLKFDDEYDLLPATQSAATAMGQENQMFSAFLGNITNSVNYPALANWTSVENMIKTQVGQAITGNPSQVLGAIQQTASSGS
ncbi:MAG TPA: extracellular solute-binding protein [Streptosporangiaceae bacterium]|nr:extracellular solute-binding protein [Streptosporangiaceae bacterium]